MNYPAGLTNFIEVACSKSTLAATNCTLEGGAESLSHQITKGFPFCTSNNEFLEDFLRLAQLPNGENLQMSDNLT